MSAANIKEIPVKLHISVDEPKQSKYTKFQKHLTAQPSRCRYSFDQPFLSALLSLLLIAVNVDLKNFILKLTTS